MIPVAIFVKTPGASPVKTRLAAAIGNEQAEEFHRLSARATAEVVAEAGRRSGGAIAAVWAVAEPEQLEHALWSSRPRIRQGPGGLGDRLARVYSQLLRESGSAFLVGADSPQLHPGILLEAVQALKTSPFVTGPATDGGFYLFGGRLPVEHEIWTSVPYGAQDTLAALEVQVTRVGRCARLPELRDVDHGKDLDGLRRDLLLTPRGKLLEDQRALLRWLDRIK